MQDYTRGQTYGTTLWEIKAWKALKTLCMQPQHSREYRVLSETLEKLSKFRDYR